MVIQKPSKSYFLLMIVVVAALGGFILGFDSGVIVDGKDQISLSFSLSDFKWSIVASISILGAMFSLPFIGKLADKFNSKNMLMMAALIYLLGLILTSTAHHLTQLIMGRLIIGISIGTLAFSAPLYISEIAPASIRGSMILLNNAAVTAGQALSFLAAYFVHDTSPTSWKVILYIQIIPSLILLIGTMLMPKSPRWVARHHGLDEAQKILSKIRNVNAYSFQTELNDIQANISQKQDEKNFKKIFSKKFAPIFTVGVVLAILQQFVGISAIMNYGQVIFQLVGTHTIKDALFVIFLVGSINFIFTILSAFLVDYLGRRVLLLTGTIIACICMFCLSASLSNEKCAILFMIGFIIGYCISLGSIFWVLISEIYPFSIRGSVMSIITAIQYASSFIITICFLPMVNYLGSSSVFEFFAIMSFLAFLFVYLYIPETKGVQLETIEENLNIGKALRFLGQPKTA